MAEDLGVGVHFNTLVPWGARASAHRSPSIGFSIGFSMSFSMSFSTGFSTGFSQRLFPPRSCSAHPPGPSGDVRGAPPGMGTSLVSPNDLDDRIFGQCADRAHETPLLQHAPRHSSGRAARSPVAACRQWRFSPVAVAAADDEVRRDPHDAAAGRPVRVGHPICGALQRTPSSALFDAFAAS